MSESNTLVEISWILQQKLRKSIPSITFLISLIHKNKRTLGVLTGTTCPYPKKISYMPRGDKHPLFHA